MTPEYILQLADTVDPDQLWRLSWEAQQALPSEKRHQLDAGVALRRHAHEVRDVNRAAEAGKSWLITRLGPGHTARRMVKTPADHERLKS